MADYVQLELDHAEVKTRVLEVWTAPESGKDSAGTRAVLLATVTVVLARVEAGGRRNGTCFHQENGLDVRRKWVGSFVFDLPPTAAVAALMVAGSATPAVVVALPPVAVAGPVIRLGPVRIVDRGRDGDRIALVVVAAGAVAVGLGAGGCARRGRRPAVSAEETSTVGAAETATDANAEATGSSETPMVVIEGGRRQYNSLASYAGGWGSGGDGRSRMRFIQMAVPPQYNVEYTTGRDGDEHDSLFR
ncbi:uncharacterized protein AMSG_05649 [Thecamonas trahens ATCC 50062]|uniref:Uncharacterized protein n=1 Tax=Thecamonas trahens ATCC 50062 TaxID=461836 RepID=A0A0L0DB95_THETB|nr:hypothetical protein AMSG_05649 [Thecamonas trahens ATCC 50062]KNC49609.1 hypothetical protein AMSG_05649 [Thecamonas trahens ATCC 50062]|eukprot:XP_013757716.1 hypothetical protein AMSG_05649 [Thecamonas trahens ATCC 50062]